MIIKPWLVVLIILSCFGAVVGYAVNEHGLPMICYKDNQKEYLSPGKNNKAVTYHYNCRKEIIGMDFGPYSWATTGVEIIPSNTNLPRQGFPPVISIYHDSRDRLENMEVQPAVRVEWVKAASIKIVHAPGTKPDRWSHPPAGFGLTFEEGMVK